MNNPFKKKVVDAVDKAQEIVDDMARKNDPEKQRVREAVQRRGVPPLAIPMPVSEDALAAEDAAVAEKRRLINANSESRERQEGESDKEYQHRLHRLDEYEITKNMTALEQAKRNRILRETANLDKPTVESFPVGEITEIKDGRYFIKLQPHASLPTESMCGDTLLVRQVMEPYTEDDEPRLRHIKGEIGMTGTLRSTFNGLHIIWLFVVDSAA